MKKRLLDDAWVDMPLTLPSLGSLDNIELPVYTPARKAPVREEVLDAAEGLDTLTGLALRKAQEILEMVLDPEKEEFANILRAQVAQVQTVLTTQARVDEGRLKKKQVDKLGELLEIMRTEELKLIPGRVLN